MEVKRFTIGCDPEFALRDGSGKLISAIPFIDGTKEKPKPLPSGGNIQRDNVNVEFGTQPAESAAEFISRIRGVLADSKAELPAGCRLDCIASATYDPDQLDTEEAKMFGCTPDYCAWDIAENPTPSVEDPTFRSCGGHIHVGSKDGTEFLLEFGGKVWMVRMMDVFLGIVSTVLDNSPESVERRKLYGKAGCHRATEYGVEYRALSNWWCKSPIFVHLMYSLTNDALAFLAKQPAAVLEDPFEGRIELVEMLGSDNIRAIINTGNATAALEAIEKHLKPHMSSESLEMLDMALEKIKVVEDIQKEWEV